MVEMANCAIIHWACDGTILFVNAFTQRLFGYGYDQMVGRSVDLIVPDKETGGNGNSACNGETHRKTHC